MRKEEKKLGRDIGWIIGLGLLGVVAARLIDPGQENEGNWPPPPPPQDRIGAGETHQSG